MTDMAFLCLERRAMHSVHEFQRHECFRQVLSTYQEWGIKIDEQYMGKVLQWAQLLFRSKTSDNHGCAFLEWRWVLADTINEAWREANNEGKEDENIQEKYELFMTQLSQCDNWVMKSMKGNDTIDQLRSKVNR